jgi:putative oxidoreductase
MTLLRAGEPARAIQVIEAHTRHDPFYVPIAAGQLGLARNRAQHQRGCCVTTGLATPRRDERCPTSLNMAANARATLLAQTSDMAENHDEVTAEMPMQKIMALWPVLARVLMASLFIWDGVLQLRDPGGTAKYFASVHIPLPEVAVWISILVHLLGGFALVLGFKTRWAAAALCLLCLGTAFWVHLPVGDVTNMMHFYKNLAMAGGFLYVMNYGAGGLSIDGMQR